MISRWTMESLIASRLNFATEASVQTTRLTASLTGIAPSPGQIQAPQTAQETLTVMKMAQMSMRLALISTSPCLRPAQWCCTCLALAPHSRCTSWFRRQPTISTLDQGASQMVPATAPLQTSLPTTQHKGSMTRRQSTPPCSPLTMTVTLWCSASTATSTPMTFVNTMAMICTTEC